MLVYAVIYGFGIYYLFGLLRDGPARRPSLPPPQPSARWRSRASAPPATWPEPMDQVSLAYFWAAVIAGSILIYVVLDGFDLGVGILFGWTE